jgi:hypothetical protein
MLEIGPLNESKIQFYYWLNIMAVSRKIIYKNSNLNFHG